MNDDAQQPFADVVFEGDGFSIPELKWRELLFVGALRRDGDVFLRDSARPLPPFQDPDLFPVGVGVRAEQRGGRVFLRRSTSA